MGSDAAFPEIIVSFDPPVPGTLVLMRCVQGFYEATIVGYSPTGGFVKIKWDINKETSWVRVHNIVEILELPPPGPGEHEVKMLEGWLKL